MANPSVNPVAVDENKLRSYNYVRNSVRWCNTYNNTITYGINKHQVYLYVVIGYPSLKLSGFHRCEVQGVIVPMLLPA